MANANLAQDGSYNTVNQPSYTVNTNGTVTDTVTGLIWQQCSAGLSGGTCTGTVATHTWASAGTYCSGLTLGGSSVWRLPTVTELSWLVKNEGTAPYINQTVFPATVSSPYWTSTSYASPLVSDAWNVNFGYGGISHSDSSNNGGMMGVINSYDVRCVR